MTVAAGLLSGFHKHHLIPKHLGGINDPQNLVLLHPCDHAIIHFVRWKIYRTPGDAWAFNKLKKFIDSDAVVVSGMKHSDAAKQKIGIASASRPRKPMSEETKNKISQAKKGRQSNRKGAKFSEESKQKMREAHLGQPAWNKGLTGVQTAWNKGLVGAQKSWNKGNVGLVKWSEEAKARHSERIKMIWEKRRSAPQ